MAPDGHYPLNRPFRPAPALVTSLSVNFLFFFLLILSFSVFPVLLASGFEPGLFLITGGIVLVPVAVFFVWIGQYYRSMWYELRDDEMSWKRGVWFHTTGIVPYNRITNLDIKQGPVMRALGISTLAIQTAGYSGKGMAEIRIEGMEHAEELRELIRTLVRQSGASSGDGTGGAHAPAAAVTTDLRILEELVTIRQLLERQGK
jgi:membrane protein YdbS with pleckstrin-like domain